MKMLSGFTVKRMLNLMGTAGGGKQFTKEELLELNSKLNKIKRQEDITMSKTREVRPFGARDKFGYLFGDLANDFSFIWLVILSILLSIIVAIILKKKNML